MSFSASQLTTQTGGLARLASKTGPIENVLFVDIPSVPYAVSDPELAEVAREKAELERLTHSDPYARQFTSRPYGYGLLSIARFVRDLGVEIGYVDFNDYYVDGDPTRFETAEAVFIGLNFCLAESLVINLARHIKRWNSNVAVIVGGQHASHRAKELLNKSPHIDLIIKGEGEIPVRELIREPSSYHEILGVAYRSGDGIIENGTAPAVGRDVIPYPDYSLLGEKLGQYGLRLMTGRGCANSSCLFCAEGKYFGKSRARPASSVVEELEYLRRSLKVLPAHIHIADSTFPTTGQRHYKKTIELCEAMGPFATSFEFSCNMLANGVHPELLQAMRRANFTKIFVGLEDPSPQVLKEMGKRISLAGATRTLELLKSHGFETGAYTIFGLPGSTPETLENHIEIIASLVRGGLLDEVFDAMYVPVPGTAPYTNPRLHGMEIITHDLSRYHRDDAPVYRLETVSEHDLRRGFIESRRAIIAAYKRTLGIQP